MYRASLATSESPEALSAARMRSRSTGRRSWLNFQRPSTLEAATSKATMPLSLASTNSAGKVSNSAW